MFRIPAVFLLWLTLLLANSASATDELTLSDIRLEGLQRVSAGSVFAAFPIQVGERVGQARLQDAVRTLFATGLFDDISLGKIAAEDGSSVLVLQLAERPSIAEIKVDGNKNITTEDLMEGLTASGLAEGEVFQRSTLERIQMEISRSYIAQGRYNATVKAEVESLERNRVRINLDIIEGPLSAIVHINFIGNQAVEDDDLLDLMELSESGFFSDLFNEDKYSRSKLNGDLERLSSWYLNHGYLRSSIESTQVSLSPDKEEVFITVSIAEGPQYTVRDIELKGDLKVPEEELRELLLVKPGDVFSREVLTASSDLLSRRLGSDGYTFASVNAVPQPHDDNTATVIFLVEPGKRAYVRKINFRGNTSTADEVLRQELVQMEGAAASTNLIEISRERLEKTGFFKTVAVETPTVPGRPDQIDVNYNVEEQSTGSLSASFGYSPGAGLLLGLNVSEKNFLGTGRQVSFGLNRSQSVESANLSYRNPFYTVDGVSRGFNLAFRKTDYEDVDLASYTSDSSTAGVDFGYPISRNARLFFGLGYDHTVIKLPQLPVREVLLYLQEHGTTFDSLSLIGGWTLNTLNRGLYPTSGTSMRLNLSLAIPEVSDVPIGKIRLDSEYYFPLSENQEWAIHTSASAAYGEALESGEEFPFFQHYYAGGIGSVRGYEPKTLGPRSNSYLVSDVDNLKDRTLPGRIPAEQLLDSFPFGGNLLFESTLELIFPFAVIEDHSQVRSTVFFDLGNVFDTNRGYDPSFDRLRASAGISLTWITPIGPLAFSLAKPINSEAEDERENFQFLLGQTF